MGGEPLGRSRGSRNQKPEFPLSRELRVVTCGPPPYTHSSIPNPSLNRENGGTPLRNMGNMGKYGGVCADGILRSRVGGVEQRFLFGCAPAQASRTSSIPLFNTSRGKVWVGGLSPGVTNGQEQLHPVIPLVRLSSRRHIRMVAPVPAAGRLTDHRVERSESHTTGSRAPCFPSAVGSGHPPHGPPRGSVSLGFSSARKPLAREHPQAFARGSIWSL